MTCSGCLVCGLLSYLAVRLSQSYTTTHVFNNSWNLCTAGWSVNRLGYGGWYRPGDQGLSDQRQSQLLIVIVLCLSESEHVVMYNQSVNTSRLTKNALLLGLYLKVKIIFFSTCYDRSVNRAHLVVSFFAWWRFFSSLRPPLTQAMQCW